LRSVVQGYFNYHAIPGNFVALRTFRREVARAWFQALRRRGQRDRRSWELRGVRRVPPAQKLDSWGGRARPKNRAPMSIFFPASSCVT
jgi:hypothetical protein